tara:strand:+ start:240 stop:596 length:357 start_codon:yes stop_codon:yes gene_type:complete
MFRIPGITPTTPADNETSITIIFNRCYQHNNSKEFGESVSRTTFKPCSTIDDFSITYDFMTQILASAFNNMHRMPIVTIQLSGKLNGIDINKTYHDIDNFQAFLHDNSFLKHEAAFKH